jgi:RNA polymerase sigma-B factor
MDIPGSAEGRAYPPSERDQRAARSREDRRLLERYHHGGDRAAREALVERFLPLARQLARRYQRGGEQLDDLVQVASLGLLKAIDRFDPERQTAFSSFAVPTILGELKRHFRDKGWAVHLPRGLQELVLRIQDADAKLGSNSRRSPTVDQIAEYLNLETEQVLEGLEAIAAHHATSMDQPIEAGQDEGTSTPHDTVGSDDEGYALVDTSASLAAAVRQLRRADREVLALRFRDDLKQSEIADKIGVSQMQVSRILRRATDQLRETVDIEPAA